MRVLYVSHRYHTNQIPIMKGWYERGVKVMFLAQYVGVSEIHDYVEFCQMKPSFITKLCNLYIDKKYPPSTAEGKKTRAFMPDLWNTYQIIKRFKPNFVILRDHTIYNLVISIICRVLGIQKIIMYTQIPLWGYHVRRHIWDCIAKYLFPKVCFTPILYKGKVRSKKEFSTGWFAPQWYIPLVCNTDNVESRIYCKDGIIHLLDVGKYREYKNHFYLVDAISLMKDHSRIRLTIIGQLSQKSEEEYYNRLKKYIEQKNLQSVIELKGNVPFTEMKEVYASADVLILPSKNESAGMVILEAMSQGLCTMCSDECGLSCYIDEYECGYVFAWDDVKQLVEELDYVAQNPEKIEMMGRKGKDTVKKHFSFNNYLDALNELTEQAFNYKINENSLS